MKSKNINKGGMGMGLTISKMILQELKGEISVKSKANHGSTFSFIVPVMNKEDKKISARPEWQNLQNLEWNNNIASSESENSEFEITTDSDQSDLE